MPVRRSLATGLGLAALVAPLTVPTHAGAAPPPIPAVDSAIEWLITQQEADGGFELADFAGFETSDAVLAIAQSAQDGPGWSDTAALAAVQAIQNGGNDPLDALDDQVDGEANPNSLAAAGRAAKIVSLVAYPLDLDASDFDPSNDSASPVDLLARIAAQDNAGTFEYGGSFNVLLYAIQAYWQSGIQVPAGWIAQVEAAQNDDGSWDYTGTSAATGFDVDTTSLALLTLAVVDREASDPVVADGIDWLRDAQAASGAWQAFGADDPNATSMAIQALSALLVDVTAAPYTSPFPYLLSLQQANGRFASPNDSFGVNTFATSQVTQALAYGWRTHRPHADFVFTLTYDLGTSMFDPNDDAAPLVSDAVGPNSSIRTARDRAAKAVLDSSYGREAAADHLFHTALDRALDPAGRAYWSNKLITISRSRMLTELTASGEFWNNAGGTNADFVDAAYDVVLDRPADPAGRAFWIARLDSGRPVHQVAASLVASTEYRRSQVDWAYDRLLDRPADPSGRAYWTSKLATTRIEVLLRSIAASQEYYEKAHNWVI